MKKLISIFLILCMIATLLPSVVFATEGEGTTVDPIVVDFTKTTLTTNTSGNTSYAGLTTPGYEIVTAKSTTKGVRVGFVGNGLNTVHDQGYGSLSAKKTWPGEKDSEYVNNLMLTINVNVATAGYYSPELIYGTNCYCGDFAIYINDQYAGEITDAYDASSTAKAEAAPMTLNTIYLKEGANEISFKCTSHRETRTQSYLLLNKLTLEPCEETFVPVTFTTSAFPKRVVAGEVVNFEISATIDESQTTCSGTYSQYNEDGSNMETNLTVASENGTFEITEQSANVVKGTFTATNGGAATITATANVNGKQYTKAINVTVTSNEDEAVTLPKISMSVSTDATGYANYLTVNGQTQESAECIYEPTVGDSVTVVAGDIEGKTFRGWLRGGVDGTPVWAEKTYTFTAATNVALYAMYTNAPVEGDSEYYDWNGEFLAYEEPATATLSKYGFSFKEWLNTVVNNITRNVADYTAANNYKITIPTGVNAEVEKNASLDAVPHDAKVTLTNGEKVSWYVDGNPVAYGISYTFYATEEADITIDETVQDGPIINLTNPNGNTYILEYNENGKTVIEKGIIFGEAGASVTSCSYKVISQRNATFGKLMAENDEGCAVVRGYIIYNDNGTYRVAYADIAE